MNNTIISSTPDSIFQVAPLNKSRTLGPIHPWDFNNNQNNFLKTTPSLSISSNNLSLPKTSNSFNIDSYDVKVIPIVSKIVTNPQYKQLIDSYKRNQLPLRQGYISNKFFLNSLQIYQIRFKKSEVNVLLKEFRAIGLPDTFAYNDFLQVCNYIKDHSK